MNCRANENQVFLKGVHREGWVVRTDSLLWMTYYGELDRPTAMESPL